MSEQIFRVYVVGKQSAAQAIEVSATDTRIAAEKFTAMLNNVSQETEIAVITSNGFEDVYGYRSIVPQAHLDD